MVVDALQEVVAPGSIVIAEKGIVLAGNATILVFAALEGRSEWTKDWAQRTRAAEFATEMIMCNVRVR